MEIGVSNRVIVRNSIGQFIRECEVAAQRTVEDMIKEGARLSRAEAPVGHKHDSRTIPLKDSIKTRMTSRTSGEWYATARHAMPQEKGAAPHVITGSPDLSFYWEAAGRRFIPASVYYGEPGKVSLVNHPGNPAHPYLRPAYEVVMSRAMSFARKNYPG